MANISVLVTVQTKTESGQTGMQSFTFAFPAKEVSRLVTSKLGRWLAEAVTAAARNMRNPIPVQESAPVDPTPESNPS